MGPKVKCDKTFKEREKKFSSEELEAMLKCAKDNKSLILALPNKLNVTQKDQLFADMTTAVNAVSGSGLMRTKDKVRKKWSDWLYYTKVKGGKEDAKMTKIDRRLLDEFIKENTESDEEVGKDKQKQAVKNETQRYDENDKSYLVSLISKRKHILFGPLNNKNTHDLINKTWSSIAKEMCEVTGISKSIKQLQDKFSKMSTVVKQKAAQINRFERQSGMNEEKPLQLTPLEEEIKGVIGDLAIEGIKGGIDMDNSAELSGGYISDDISDETLESLGEENEIIKNVSADPQAGRAADLVVRDQESARIPIPVIKEKNKKKTKSFHDKIKDDDFTKNLVQIEKRKLEILEEELEISKKRLHVEEKISGQLERLLGATSQQSHFPLPPFGSSFPPKTATLSHSNDKTYYNLSNL